MSRWSTLGSVRTTSAGRVDADDDTADLLPGVHVAVGGDDLVERIAPVDDRPERPRLEQLPDVEHRRLAALLRGEHDLPAAEERRDDGEGHVLPQRTAIRRDERTAG